MISWTSQFSNCELLVLVVAEDNLLEEGNIAASSSHSTARELLGTQPTVNYRTSEIGHSIYYPSVLFSSLFSLMAFSLLSEAAVLDSCFLTSYDLAWSTPSG